MANIEQNTLSHSGGSMWQTRETDKPMNEPPQDRSNETESRDTRSTERERNRVMRQTGDRTSQEYAISKAKLTEKRANYKRELRQWEEIWRNQLAEECQQACQMGKLGGCTKCCRGCKEEESTATLKPSCFLPRRNLKVISRKTLMGDMKTVRTRY